LIRQRLMSVFEIEYGSQPSDDEPRHAQLIHGLQAERELNLASLRTLQQENARLQTQSRALLVENERLLARTEELDRLRRTEITHLVTSLAIERANTENRRQCIFPWTGAPVYVPLSTVGNNPDLAEKLRRLHMATHEHPTTEKEESEWEVLRATACRLVDEIAASAHRDWNTPQFSYQDDIASIQYPIATASGDIAYITLENAWKDSFCGGNEPKLRAGSKIWKAVLAFVQNVCGCRPWGTPPASWAEHVCPVTVMCAPADDGLATGRRLGLRVRSSNALSIVEFDHLTLGGGSKFTSSGGQHLDPGKHFTRPAFSQSKDVFQEVFRTRLVTRPCHGMISWQQRVDGRFYNQEGQEEDEEERQEEDEEEEQEEDEEEEQDQDQDQEQDEDEDEDEDGATDSGVLGFANFGVHWNPTAGPRRRTSTDFYRPGDA
jgi:hypothetical protein